MIKVSDIAKKKILQLMKDDGFNPTIDFVRVGVKSGGCSGLSKDRYGFHCSAQQVSRDFLKKHQDRLFNDEVDTVCGRFFPKLKD